MQGWLLLVDFLGPRVVAVILQWNIENTPGASQDNRTVVFVCHVHAVLRCRSVPSQRRDCTGNADHHSLETEREREREESSNHSDYSRLVWKNVFRIYYYNYLCVL
jgi:hypothetical protein